MTQRATILDVRDFGADSRAVPAANDAAFQRCLDAVAALSALGPSGYSFSGAAVYVPRGTYHLSRTLHLPRQMLLYGDGGSGTGACSVLTWPAGVDGLVVHHMDTPKLRSDWTVIRDLAVCGAGADWVHPWSQDPDSPLHGRAGNGILVYGRARLENLYVAGWPLDGVKIDTTFDQVAHNANGWRIDHCRIDQCGRHGVYAAGENSNAGLATGVDVGHVGGWGFYERSFLGNTYLACQAAECLLGSYYTSGSVNRSTLVGCYAEGDSPIRLKHPATLVGGVTTNLRADCDGVVLNDAGLSGCAVRSPVYRPCPTFTRKRGLPVTSMEQFAVRPNDPGVYIDATEGNCEMILPAPGVQVAGLSFDLKRLDTTAHVVWLITGNRAKIDGSEPFVLKGGTGITVRADVKDYKIVGRF